MDHATSANVHEIADFPRRMSEGWTSLSSTSRMSHLLRRFMGWTIASVFAAIVMDIYLGNLYPDRSYWLHILILMGITLPLLLLGGTHFTRQAMLQERALHRRDARHWRQARRDPLTLADNRQALKEAIARLNQVRPGVQAALFVLDLHEFQRINDACGHRVGDDVLREAGQRLRSTAFAHSLHDDDSAVHPRMRGMHAPRLVRVGSDELGIWFPLWPAGKSPSDVAHDMLWVLQKPFAVAGLQLYVRGNVGYVMHTAGQVSASDWLTRANAATQQAKRLGVGRHAAFEPEQIDALVKRLGIQQALQACVCDGSGFTLEYQPIVSMELKTLMGCEALLRWKHPEWGDVSPASFIPIAEGSDLIRPLGRWVLRQAIRQMAAWRAQMPVAAMLRLKVSVNLSRAQLHDPELAPLIEQLLEEYEVPASALRLEVTESLPLDDPDSLATLERLRQLGTTLALDDFGTGYSSLAALLNLPVRCVKIDREFISGIDTCPYRQALVSSVVRVAEVMGLEVVAEGIEQEAEARKLQALGCRQIQGWYVSRALPPDVFAQRWLQAPAAQSEPEPETNRAPSSCDPSACTLNRFGSCPTVTPASRTADPVSAPSF